MASRSTRNGAWLSHSWVPLLLVLLLVGVAIVHGSAAPRQTSSSSPFSAVCLYEFESESQWGQHADSNLNDPAQRRAKDVAAGPAALSSLRTAAFCTRKVQSHRVIATQETQAEQVDVHELLLWHSVSSSSRASSSAAASAAVPAEEVAHFHEVRLQAKSARTSERVRAHPVDIDDAMIEFLPTARAALKQRQATHPQSRVGQDECAKLIEQAGMPLSRSFVLSYPFYFTRSSSGEVLSILYDAAEPSDTLEQKKQIVAALHVNVAALSKEQRTTMAEDAASFTRHEVDQEGRYLATYTTTKATATAMQGEAELVSVHRAQDYDAFRLPTAKAAKTAALLHQRNSTFLVDTKTGQVHLYTSHSQTLAQGGTLAVLLTNKHSTVRLLSCAREVTVPSQHEHRVPAALLNAASRPAQSVMSYDAAQAELLSSLSTHRATAVHTRRRFEPFSYGQVQLDVLADLPLQHALWGGSIDAPRRSSPTLGWLGGLRALSSVQDEEAELKRREANALVNQEEDLRRPRIGANGMQIAPAYVQSKTPYALLAAERLQAAMDAQRTPDDPKQTAASASLHQRRALRRWLDQLPSADTLFARVVMNPDAPERALHDPYSGASFLQLLSCFPAQPSALENAQGQDSVDCLAHVLHHLSSSFSLLQQAHLLLQERLDHVELQVRAAEAARTSLTFQPLDGELQALFEPVHTHVISMLVESIGITHVHALAQRAEITVFAAIERLLSLHTRLVDLRADALLEADAQETGVAAGVEHPASEFLIGVGRLLRVLEGGLDKWTAQLHHQAVPSSTLMVLLLDRIPAVEVLAEEIKSAEEGLSEEDALARAYHLRDLTLSYRQHFLLLLSSNMHRLRTVLEEHEAVPTFEPEHPVLYAAFGQSLQRRTPACVLCAPVLSLLLSEWGVVAAREADWAIQHELLAELVDLHWDSMGEEERADWMARGRGVSLSDFHSSHLAQGSAKEHAVLEREAKQQLASWLVATPEVRAHHAADDGTGSSSSEDSWFPVDPHASKPVAHENELMGLLLAMSNTRDEQFKPLLMEHVEQHRSTAVNIVAMRALENFPFTEEDEAALVRLLHRQPPARLVHQQDGGANTRAEVVRHLADLALQRPLSSVTVRNLTWELLHTPVMTPADWAVCAKACEQHCVNNGQSEGRCEFRCKRECEQSQRYQDELTQLLQRVAAQGAPVEELLNEHVDALLEDTDELHAALKESTLPHHMSARLEETAALTSAPTPVARRRLLQSSPTGVWYRLTIRSSVFQPQAELGDQEMKATLISKEVNGGYMNVGPLGANFGFDVDISYSIRNKIKSSSYDFVKSYFGFSADITTRHTTPDWVASNAVPADLGNVVNQVQSRREQWNDAVRKQFGANANGTTTNAPLLRFARVDQLPTSIRAFLRNGTLHGLLNGSIPIVYDQANRTDQLRLTATYAEAYAVPLDAFTEAALEWLNISDDALGRREAFESAHKAARDVWPDDHTEMMSIINSTLALTKNITDGFNYITTDLRRTLVQATTTGDALAQLPSELSELTPPLASFVRDTDTVANLIHAVAEGVPLELDAWKRFIRRTDFDALYELPQVPTERPSIDRSSLARFVDAMQAYQAMAASEFAAPSSWQAAVHEMVQEMIYLLTRIFDQLDDDTLTMPQVAALITDIHGDIDSRIAQFATKPELQLAPVSVSSALGAAYLAARRAVEENTEDAAAWTWAVESIIEQVELLQSVSANLWTYLLELPASAQQWRSELLTPDSVHSAAFDVAAGALQFSAELAPLQNVSLSRTAAFLDAFNATWHAHNDSLSWWGQFHRTVSDAADGYFEASARMLAAVGPLITDTTSAPARARMAQALKPVCITTNSTTNGTAGNSADCSLSSATLLSALSATESWLFNVDCVSLGCSVSSTLLSLESYLSPLSAVLLADLQQQNSALDSNATKPVHALLGDVSQHAAFVASLGDVPPQANNTAAFRPTVSALAALCNSLSSTLSGVIPDYSGMPASSRPKYNRVQPAVWRSMRAVIDSLLAASQALRAQLSPGFVQSVSAEGLLPLLDVSVLVQQLRNETVLAGAGPVALNSSAVLAFNASLDALGVVAKSSTSTSGAVLALLQSIDDAQRTASSQLQACLLQGSECDPTALLTALSAVQSSAEEWHAVAGVAFAWKMPAAFGNLTRGAVDVVSSLTALSAAERSEPLSSTLLNAAVEAVARVRSTMQLLEDAAQGALGTTLPSLQWQYPTPVTAVLQRSLVTVRRSLLEQATLRVLVGQQLVCAGWHFLTGSEQSVALVDRLVAFAALDWQAAGTTRESVDTMLSDMEELLNQTALLPTVDFDANDVWLAPLVRPLRNFRDSLASSLPLVEALRSLQSSATDAAVVQMMREAGLYLSQQTAMLNVFRAEAEEAVALSPAYVVVEPFLHAYLQNRNRFMNRALQPLASLGQVLSGVYKVMNEFVFDAQAAKASITPQSAGTARTIARVNGLLFPRLVSFGEQMRAATRALPAYRHTPGEIDRTLQSLQAVQSYIDSCNGGLLKVSDVTNAIAYVQRTVQALVEIRNDGGLDDIRQFLNTLRAMLADLRSIRATLEESLASKNRFLDDVQRIAFVHMPSELMERVEATIPAALDYMNERLPHFDEQLKPFLSRTSYNLWRVWSLRFDANATREQILKDNTAYLSELSTLDGSIARFMASLNGSTIHSAVGGMRELRGYLEGTALADAANATLQTVEHAAGVMDDLQSMIRSLRATGERMLQLPDERDALLAYMDTVLAEHDVPLIKRRGDILVNNATQTLQEFALALTDFLWSTEGNATSGAAWSVAERTFAGLLSRFQQDFPGLFADEMVQFQTQRMDAIIRQLEGYLATQLPLEEYMGALDVWAQWPLQIDLAASQTEDIRDMVLRWMLLLVPTLKGLIDVPNDASSMLLALSQLASDRLQDSLFDASLQSNFGQVSCPTCPPPTSDPFGVLLRDVISLADDLNQVVLGLQAIHRLLEDFVDDHYVTLHRIYNELPEFKRIAATAGQMQSVLDGNNAAPASRALLHDMCRRNVSSQELYFTGGGGLVSFYANDTASLSVSWFRSLCLLDLEELDSVTLSISAALDALGQQINTTIVDNMRQTAQMAHKLNAPLSEDILNNNGYSNGLAVFPFFDAARCVCQSAFPSGWQAGPSQSSALAFLCVMGATLHADETVPASMPSADTMAQRTLAQLSAFVQEAMADGSSVVQSVREQLVTLSASVSDSNVEGGVVSAAQLLSFPLNIAVDTAASVWRSIQVDLGYQIGLVREFQSQLRTSVPAEHTARSSAVPDMLQRFDQLSSLLSFAARDARDGTALWRFTPLIEGRANEQLVRELTTRMLSNITATTDLWHYASWDWDAEAGGLRNTSIVALRFMNATAVPHLTHTGAALRSLLSPDNLSVALRSISRATTAVQSGLLTHSFITVNEYTATCNASVCLHGPTYISPVPGQQWAYADPLARYAVFTELVRATVNRTTKWTLPGVISEAFEFKCSIHFHMRVAHGNLLLPRTFLHAFAWRGEEFADALGWGRSSLLVHQSAEDSRVLGLYELADENGASWSGNVGGMALAGDYIWVTDDRYLPEIDRRNNELVAFYAGDIDRTFTPHKPRTIRIALQPNNVSPARLFVSLFPSSLFYDVAQQQLLVGEYVDSSSSKQYLWTSAQPQASPAMLFMFETGANGFPELTGLEVMRVPVGPLFSPPISNSTNSTVVLPTPPEVPVAYTAKFYRNVGELVRGVSALEQVGERVVSLMRCKYEAQFQCRLEFHSTQMTDMRSSFADNVLSSYPYDYAKETGTQPPTLLQSVPLPYGATSLHYDGLNRLLVPISNAAGVHASVMSRLNDPRDATLYTVRVPPLGSSLVRVSKNYMLVNVNGAWTVPPRCFLPIEQFQCASPKCAAGADLSSCIAFGTVAETGVSYNLNSRTPVTRTARPVPTILPVSSKTRTTARRLLEAIEAEDVIEDLLQAGQQMQPEMAALFERKHGMTARMQQLHARMLAVQEQQQARLAARGLDVGLGSRWHRTSGLVPMAADAAEDGTAAASGRRLLRSQQSSLSKQEEIPSFKQPSVWYLSPQGLPASSKKVPAGSKSSQSLLQHCDTVRAQARQAGLTAAQIKFRYPQCARVSDAVIQAGTRREQEYAEINELPGGMQLQESCFTSTYSVAQFSRANSNMKGYHTLNVGGYNVGVDITDSFEFGLDTKFAICSRGRSLSVSVSPYAALKDSGNNEAQHKLIFKVGAVYDNPKLKTTLTSAMSYDMKDALKSCFDAPRTEMNRKLNQQYWFTSLTCTCPIGGDTVGAVLDVAFSIFDVDLPTEYPCWCDREYGDLIDHEYAGETVSNGQGCSEFGGMMQSLPEISMQQLSKTHIALKWRDCVSSGLGTVEAYLLLQYDKKSDGEEKKVDVSNNGGLWVGTLPTPIPDTIVLVCQSSSAPQQRSLRLKDVWRFDGPELNEVGLETVRNIFSNAQPYRKASSDAEQLYLPSPDALNQTIWVTHPDRLAWNFTTKQPVVQARYTLSARDFNDSTFALTGPVITSGIMGRFDRIHAQVKDTGSAANFTISRQGELQLQHMGNYSLELELLGTAGIFTRAVFPLRIDLTLPTMAHGFVNRSSGDEWWQPNFRLSDPESGIDWNTVEFALVRTTLDLEHDLLTPWFPYLDGSRQEPLNTSEIVSPAVQVDWLTMAPYTIELAVRVSNKAGATTVLFTRTPQQALALDTSPPECSALMWRTMAPDAIGNLDSELCFSLSCSDRDSGIVQIYYELVNPLDANFTANFTRRGDISGACVPQSIVRRLEDGVNYYLVSAAFNYRRLSTNVTSPPLSVLLTPPLCRPDAFYAVDDEATGAQRVNVSGAADSLTFDYRLGVYEPLKGMQSFTFSVRDADAPDDIVPEPKGLELYCRCTRPNGQRALGLVVNGTTTRCHVAAVPGHEETRPAITCAAIDLVPTYITTYNCSVVFVPPPVLPTPVVNGTANATLNGTSSAPLNSSSTPVNGTAAVNCTQLVDGQLVSSNNCSEGWWVEQCTPVYTFLSFNDTTSRTVTVPGNVTRFTFRGLRLQHGHRYVVQATGVNRVNTSTAGVCISSPVVVDRTPPENGDVAHGNPAFVVQDAHWAEHPNRSYTWQSDQFHLYPRIENFTEDYSEVSSYAMQGIDWRGRPICLQQPVRDVVAPVVESIVMTHRRAYLVQIEACNSVGLCVLRNSSYISIDLTPATLEWLSYAGRQQFDGSYYLNNAYKPHVIAVKLRDVESGLDGNATASWCLGSSPGSCDFTPWSNVTLDSDAVFRGTGTNTFNSSETQQLLQGRFAYFTVRAVNGAFLPGIVAAGKRQMYFIAPRNGRVLYGQPGVFALTFTPSASYLQVNWRDFSDQAGIVRYEISLGTADELDDVVPQKNVRMATQLTLRNLQLRDGQSYYATVSAYNAFGLVRRVSGGAIRVDTSPPQIGDVEVYVNSVGQPNDLLFWPFADYLPVSWTGFVDPESGIAMQEVAIGTAPLQTDVTLFTGVYTTGVGFELFITGGLRLSDGMTVFAAVRATNFAGLSSVVSSSGLTVDSSPAVCNFLSQVGATRTPMGGLATNASAPLAAEWSCADPQSDVYSARLALYSYASSMPLLVVPITDAGRKATGPYAYADSSTLLQGETYYWQLLVLNGARLSTLLYSAGAIVDRTPPLARVQMGASQIVSRYLSSLSALPLFWAVSDPETGLTSVEVGVVSAEALSAHTSSGQATALLVPDALPFVAQPTSQTVVSLPLRNYTGVTLLEGSRYYAVLRAVNGLGMRTVAVAAFDFIIDTSLPQCGNVSVPLPAPGFFSSRLLSGSINCTAAAGMAYYIVSFVHTASGAAVSTATRVPAVLQGSTSFGISTSALTHGEHYTVVVQAVSATGGAVTRSSSPLTYVSEAPALGSLIFVPLLDTSLEYVSTAQSLTGLGFQTALTGLQLRWVAPVDSASGVCEQELQIGTSLFGDNVLPWTAVGRDATSASFPSLALSEGTSYYAMLRVTSCVLLQSRVTALSDMRVLRSGPAVQSASVKQLVDGSLYSNDGERETGLSAQVKFPRTTDDAGVSLYHINLEEQHDGATEWQPLRNTTLVSASSASLEFVFTELSALRNMSWRVSVRATNRLGLTGEPVRVTLALPFGQLTAGAVRDGTGFGGVGDEVNGPSNIDIDYQTDRDALFCSWQGFNSPRSALSYEWALGSSNSTQDVQDWEAVPAAAVKPPHRPGGMIRQFKQHQLDLLQGRRYYCHVRATEIDSGISVQAVSDGVIVDSTAPLIVNVSVASAPFSNSSTLLLTESDSIWLLWAASDAESGLARVELAVGSYPHSSDLMAWTPVDPQQLLAGAGALPLANLSTPLTTGLALFPSVRVTNGAGLSSVLSVHSSQPAFFATAPPQTGQLSLTLTPSGSDDYVARLSIGAGWIDYFSGIETFAVQFGESAEEAYGAAGSVQTISSNGERIAEFTAPLTFWNALQDSSLWATVTAVNVLNLNASASVSVPVHLSPPSAAEAVSSMSVDSLSDLLSDAAGVAQPALQPLTDFIKVRWDGFAVSSSRALAWYEVNVMRVGTSELVAQARVQAPMSHIAFSQVALVPGATYEASVRAQDDLGLLSERIRSRVLADASAPVMPSAPQVSSALLQAVNMLGQGGPLLVLNDPTVSVEFAPVSDEESGIAALEWRVCAYSVDNGTAADSIDVDSAILSLPSGATAGNNTQAELCAMPWTSIADPATAHSASSSAAELVEGSSYQVFLRSRNGVGLVRTRVSLPFLYSQSAPTRGVVYTGSALGVDVPYAADLDNIQCAWGGFTDNAIGISYFVVQVGSTAGDTDLVEPMQVPRTESKCSAAVSAARLSDLSPTGLYYVSVSAVNAVGLVTKVTAPAVVVDLTPPSTGSVRMGATSLRQEELVQADTTRLTAVIARDEWLDGQSGIADFSFSVGTDPSNGLLDDVAPLQSLGRLSVIRFHSTLQDGVTYYIRVVATNGAGLSASAVSKGVLVNSRGPEQVGEVVHRDVAALLSPFDPVLPVPEGATPSGEPTHGNALYVSADWSGTFVDSLSNITEYSWRVCVRGADKCDGTEWYDVMLTTNVTALMTPPLQTGVRYRVEVKATNAAGRSTVAATHWFLVDATPATGLLDGVSSRFVTGVASGGLLWPQARTLRDGQVWLARDASSFDHDWSALQLEDEVSGVMRVELALGAFPRDDSYAAFREVAVGNASASAITQHRFAAADAQLRNDATHVFATLRVTNGAGLHSLFSSSGVRLSTELPVPPTSIVLTTPGAAHSDPSMRLLQRRTPIVVEWSDAGTVLAPVLEYVIRVAHVSEATWQALPAGQRSGVVDASACAFDTPVLEWSSVGLSTNGLLVGDLSACVCACEVQVRVTNVLQVSAIGVAPTLLRVRSLNVQGTASLGLPGTKLQRARDFAQLSYSFAGIGQQEIVLSAVQYELCIVGQPCESAVQLPRNASASLMVRLPAHLQNGALLRVRVTAADESGESFVAQSAALAFDNTAPVFAARDGLRWNTPLDTSYATLPSTQLPDALSLSWSVYDGESDTVQSVLCLAQPQAAPDSTTLYSVLQQPLQQLVCVTLPASVRRASLRLSPTSGVSSVELLSAGAGVSPDAAVVYLPQLPSERISGLAFVQANLTVTNAANLSASASTPLLSVATQLPVPAEGMLNGVSFNFSGAQQSFPVAMEARAVSDLLVSARSVSGLRGALPTFLTNGSESLTLSWSEWSQPGLPAQGAMHHYELSVWDELSGEAMRAWHRVGFSALTVSLSQLPLLHASSYAICLRGYSVAGSSRDQCVRMLVDRTPPVGGVVLDGSTAGSDVDY